MLLTHLVVLSHAHTPVAVARPLLHSYRHFVVPLMEVEVEVVGAVYLVIAVIPVVPVVVPVVVGVVMVVGWV